MSDERPLSEELFHQANRVCGGKDVSAGLLARCGHRAAALEAKTTRLEAALKAECENAPTSGF